jgi:hypothetical protein
MVPELVVDAVVESYKLVEPANSLTRSGPLIELVLNKTGVNQISSLAPHFVYIIRMKMRSPDVREWIIKKRFSELSRLDRNLAEMTRSLPAFPSRGARRELTDDCATRRLHGLNHYFSIVCQMPEIVKTKHFMQFFEFEPHYHHNWLPRCVAEIHPVPSGQTRILKDSEMCMSSMSISNDWLLTTLSNRPSISTKLSRYITSLLSRSRSQSSIDQSQIILWKRLPNSFLFEKTLLVSNIPARITCSIILQLDVPSVMFGSTDGRVGFVQNTARESSPIDYINTGSNPGSAVSALCIDTTMESRIAVWVAWADGSLKLFSFTNSSWTSEYRIQEIWATSEQVYVTSIISSASTVFCGLSNGVISVLNRSCTEYRQVTILQGPPTFITSLSLSSDIIYATHSCGLMDAVEGSNSIQPWKVGEILSRGTEKLNPWGPVTSSCIAGVALNNTTIAVASARGVIYLVNSNKCDLMFDVDAISTLERGCLATLNEDENMVVVACENMVKFFQVQSDQDITRYVDISYLDVCHSDQIVGETHEVTNISSSNKNESDEDDDLHSWARDL